MQFLFSFGGSSGVIGFEAELPLAILSHKKNWKMTEAVSGVQFYDDAVSFGENLKAQPSSFGITPQIMETLAQQKVIHTLFSLFKNNKVQVLLVLVLTNGI